MARYVVAATCLLAAAACGRPGDPVDASSTERRVEAGDTVRLRVGEVVELGGTNARVTLAAVPADSRCPVDVTCVWQGDAHVRLEGTAPTTPTMEPIDLHTTLDPKEATFAGWRIRLLDVAPQRTQQDNVRQQDYSVLLAISRG
jgi:hypothetical protein